MNHDELKNYFSEIKSTKPKNNCPDCAIRVDTYLKSIEEWREELNRYKAAMEKCKEQRDGCLHVPIQQYRMRGRHSEYYNKELDAILKGDS